jgi:hypothetical protein
MALSLSITDVWKIFGERKAADKQRVATWLDGVAEDARALADTWAKMYTELQNGTSDVSLGFGPEIIYRNAPPFARLMDFYESASAVIGGKIDEDYESDFFFALARLIREREVTRERYEQTFRGKRIRGLTTEDTCNFGDLAEAVRKLNREAAALEVLARNFRAKA